MSELSQPRKVVLVNGATGGIGSAIVRELAADYHVVLLGRDQQRLDRTLATVPAGGEASTHLADLTNSHAAEEALAQITSQRGPVFGIVHAAGDGPVADLATATDASWQSTFEGKVFGAVRLVRAAEPHMVPGSRVVMINGSFHKTPHPLFVVNSAANAALIAFAKAISTSLGANGTRVMVIDPGPVETPLWAQTAEQLGTYLQLSPEQVTEQIAQGSPLGGLTQPNEVADLVRFLLSPAAARLTGTGITLDGGSCATY